MRREFTRLHFRRRCQKDRMGKPYSRELDSITATLAWCESVELVPQGGLPSHLQGERLVCIGSGGSFSAAEFTARTAETTQGVHAVALTPMEYVQRIRTLGPHRTFLLSAEGKNSDIRMAAATALAEALHTTVLTFGTRSPLIDLIREDGSATSLAFEPPWGKDGYLATNSLVASHVLVARFFGMPVDTGRAALEFSRQRQAMADRTAITSVATGARILAVHGVSGAVPAIDLECKFAESAFGTVQRSDLRQFAHGRHIQLSQGLDRFIVVAFVAAEESDLWVAMRGWLPASTEVVTCLMPDGPGNGALQGLLFVMALVEAVGRAMGRDAGEPLVPTFARKIHVMEAARYLPMRSVTTRNPKITILRRTGLRWADIAEAMNAFAERLRGASLRGLVLDFDGTCCETSLRLEGMDGEIAEEIRRLLASGVQIAFASGRGDSLHNDLRKHLEPSTWERVLLGCHSGSSLVRLSENWHEVPCHESFASLDVELCRQGIHREGGYNIRAKGGQYTIQCPDADSAMRAFLLASEAARTRTGWRAFRSSHSVDILTDSVGKTAVVRWLATETLADAKTQLLRIGDRGEVFGNDQELLASGLSLSVDGVSTDPHTCWVFGDETLSASQRAVSYLRSLEIVEGSSCRVSSAAIDQWIKRADLSLQQHGSLGL